MSLIDASQQRLGYPSLGVRYGSVDFAAACAGLGGWARRVETMDQLDGAVHDALSVERPAVIDVVVDPAEYFPQGASVTRGVMRRVTKRCARTKFDR